MNVKQFVTLVAALAMTTAGCQIGHNLPPASRLLEPGPGVGGPGPGVIPPPGPDAIDPAMGGPSMMGGPIGGGGGGEDGQCLACGPGGGVVSTSYSEAGPACLGGNGMVVQRTVQVLFAEPESMQLQWDVTGLFDMFRLAPLCTMHLIIFVQDRYQQLSSLGIMIVLIF